MPRFYTSDPDVARAHYWARVDCQDSASGDYGPAPDHPWNPGPLDRSPDPDDDVRPYYDAIVARLLPEPTAPCSRCGETFPMATLELDGGYCSRCLSV